MDQKQQQKKTKRERVKSFLADAALDRRIRTEAARLERDESYVMRLYLRKAFGLKERGTL